MRKFFVMGLVIATTVFVVVLINKAPPAPVPPHTCTWSFDAGEDVHWYKKFPCHRDNPWQDAFKNLPGGRVPDKFLFLLPDGGKFTFRRTCKLEWELEALYAEEEKNLPPANAGRHLC